MRNIQVTSLEKHSDQSAYEKVEDGVYKIISGKHSGSYAMAFSFKRESFLVEGADEKALKEFSDDYGSPSLDFPKVSPDEETGVVEVVSASLEDLAKWRKAVAGKRIYLEHAEEVWADRGYTDDDGSWVFEGRVSFIHGDLTVKDDKPIDIRAMLDKPFEE